MYLENPQEDINPGQYIYNCLEVVGQERLVADDVECLADGQALVHKIHVAPRQAKKFRPPEPQIKEQYISRILPLALGSREEIPLCLWRKVIYTEKVDGSSITVWLDKKKKLHVCSRNKEILTHDDVFYKTADKQLKQAINPEFVYQGELLGPDIQKNKYALKEPHIFIYNVWNKSLRRYLTPDEMAQHCRGCHIDTASHALVSTAYQFTLPDSIDKLVEMANGMSELSADFRTKATSREGIVIRPWSISRSLMSASLATD